MQLAHCASHTLCSSPCSRSHAEDKLGVCLVVAAGRQDEDPWVEEPVDHALMVRPAWLLQLRRRHTVAANARIPDKYTREQEDLLAGLVAEAVHWFG